MPFASELKALEIWETLCNPLSGINRRETSREETLL